MVQWFKRIISLFTSKKKKPLQLEGVSQSSLMQSISQNWGMLYSVKSEESWKILMDQLRHVKSIEALKMSELPLNEKTTLLYANQRGKVEAYDTFVGLVEEQIARIEKKSKSKGKVKQGEANMLKRRRPRHGAPVSIKF